MLKVVKSFIGLVASVAVTSTLILAAPLFAQSLLTTVDHPPIGEQSALLASPSYPDVFWVLMDSGNDPALFPLDPRGQIIIPGFLQEHYSSGEVPYPGLSVLGAQNQDWESLAHLGDTLVIADMGNNYNYRRDLALYFLLEPNPYQCPAATPFLRLTVAYPDQTSWPAREWRFDCEATFSYKGELYFLTKHRKDRHPEKPAPSTRLYRLDTRDPGIVNNLTFVAELEDLGGWVTAADMSPDDERLAILVQNPLVSSVWVFRAPKQGDDFFSMVPLVIPMPKVRQVEGIAFRDTESLIVSNEQRDWFLIQLDEH